MSGPEAHEGQSDVRASRESSKIGAAAILGIVGIAAFPLVWLMGLTGLANVVRLVPLVAWFLGWLEVRAIKDGRKPPDGLGTAKSAKVLGIVGSIAWILLPALALVLHHSGVINLYPLFDGGTFGAWN